MNTYALTIRKSCLVSTHKQAQQVIKDLTFFVTQLKKTRTDIDIRHHYECVERNSRFNIHLHAMLSSPNKVQKSEIKHSKGYHVNFGACRSRLAWECYISKDKDTPEAILRRVQSTAGVGSPLGHAEDNPVLDIETHSDPEFLEYGNIIGRIKKVNLFEMA